MRISQLTHRVALCSAYDEALTTTAVILKRQTAFETMARVVPVRGTFWLKNLAERENRENHSHLIYIRWSPNFDIGGYAWIFEQRAQSGGRWYKVISVREEDDAARWWMFAARIVEKGDVRLPDEATPREGAFAPRPPKG